MLEEVDKLRSGFECLFPEKTRSIHPLEVNEEECIVSSSEIRYTVLTCYILIFYVHELIC